VVVVVVVFGSISDRSSDSRNCYCSSSGSSGGRCTCMSSFSFSGTSSSGL
jgi:hypothetical protein